MEASNNDENNVTVDFDAQVFGRDGSFFEKDILLPASVYQRGLTDRPYRARVAYSLFRQHRNEILALRSSWHCNYCEGGFIDFGASMSGLTSEQNGKIPLTVFLIPKCCQKECAMRAKQTMIDVAESGAAPVSVSRAYVTCDNCRQQEETAGSFQKCSRCKVAYYCGKSCQVADWPAHKGPVALFHDRPRPSTYAAILGS